MGGFLLPAFIQNNADEGVIMPAFDEREIKVINRDGLPRPNRSIRMNLADKFCSFPHGQITDTDGATVTFDFNRSLNHVVTLAGNRTFVFTAPPDPCLLMVQVTQDATGSRTVTWPSTVIWAGGTAPTLTTTANRIDRIWFWYDGTNYLEFQQKLNFTA